MIDFSCMIHAIEIKRVDYCREKLLPLSVILLILDHSSECLRVHQIFIRDKLKLYQIRRQDQKVKWF